MTPERCRQIEELYHAAREYGPEEREALLAQACRGDGELRQEVESLLAQDASTGKLLERPPWEVAPSLLGQPGSLIDEPTQTIVEPGTQLGPYRIEASIGAGGMGQVYRAVDTRLDRKVAIKICAQQFSGRFEREARAISSLNHPHICTLYDVGPNYLVMELVEGETLAARLQKGRLPMPAVLRYAAEIADALAAAHALGIIHRDLKPQNIMVTKSGVKVLDFGLAKSPRDVALTATRVVMGTPAYMAPEQLEGKECDARSDIYALGLVLYGMATGKRLPQGQPPLMEGLPPQFAHVIERCLESEPDNRWQSASDVKRELEWAGKTQVTAGNRISQGLPRWIWGIAVGGRARLLPWIIATGAFFLIAAAALPFALAHFREKPPVAAPVRFQISMPEKVTLGRGAFSLSPDGRLLVFTAAGSDGVQRLFVRALDSLGARPLPGTEGVGPFPPFWSPDSKFIGFNIGNKYMKVDVSGGPPQTLCELPGIVGTGAWNRDGVILVNGNPGPVMRVPEAGGIPSPVTAVDPARQERAHLRPSFLPDGRHFLYVRFSSNSEYTGTYIGSLDAKPQDQDRKRLLPGQFGVLYVPSSDPALGHVLFVRETTLMAQPFNTRKLELTGQPAPVAEQVGNNVNFTAFFWASDNGTLAFRGGGQFGLQLTWLDRNGNVSSRVGDPAPYFELALSPDGTRVASFHADAQRDIWLYEFARGVSTRFTFAPSIERFPLWSPDGNRLVFTSNRGGQYDLYQKNANGTGEDELLFKSDQDKIPTGWSRDGRFLLFTSSDPKTRDDIWVLPLEGDRKPVPFLRTEFDELEGSFSPDGRWVAYTSQESGRYEVCVRPFSPPGAAGSSSAGGKWQISKAGGRAPLWRGDSQELFYIADDRRVMAVEVAANLAFQAGIPQPLFSFSLAPNASNLQVTPDGKRFLITAPPQQGNVELPITVLLNWPALLKK